MATINKRISQNGCTSYQVKIRLKGHPIQSATFERLTDARKWAASIESAIREGRHFKTSESKKRIFKDLAGEYIKKVTPSLRDGRKRESHLNWWVSELGDYSLADIDGPMIQRALDRFKPRRKGFETVGAATKNRYLATISHAFSKAILWGWIEHSPMKRVERAAEPAGRTRFLDDDERERYLSACLKSSNTYLYPISLIALTTGARLSEILNLYWKEQRPPPEGAWGIVDLLRKRIVLMNTKNGERRVLPLVGKAHDSVKGLVRKTGTDLVFPSETGKKPASIRHAFEVALKTAEINNFRFHDLRHSAASYLAMSGATSGEIAAVLGHRTLAMVKRYSHHSDAHVANLVENVALKTLK